MMILSSVFFPVDFNTTKSNFVKKTSSYLVPTAVLSPTFLHSTINGKLVLWVGGLGFYGVHLSNNSFHFRGFPKYPNHQLTITVPDSSPTIGLMTIPYYIEIMGL